MKRYLKPVSIITFFLMAILQESFAETLFGSITDQRSNQPVTGAVVWIEDTDFADTTDINGTYMM
ncbi:MAG: hypothetical protein E4H13_08840, partial [Calditrichales bacterium]